MRKNGCPAYHFCLDIIILEEAKEGSCLASRSCVPKRLTFLEAFGNDRDLNSHLINVVIFFGASSHKHLVGVYKPPTNQEEEAWGFS